jgi:hypothetical protein
MTEHEQPDQEYWNADEAIGEVTLWRDQRYTLRLKAHVAEELYRQGVGEEILPLTSQRGVRTDVHARPYVLVPDVIVDVQLSPGAAARGAAGETRESSWKGMRHEELGTCQAWFYIADRSIVLWEAVLQDRYRTPQLADDSTMYALWEGFERFLIERFPSARRIATAPNDPEYDTEQYQEFLRSLGYRELSVEAFGKDLGQQNST